MRTLFFADLIPGIFRIPLKSSRILWMSIFEGEHVNYRTLFIHLTNPRQVWRSERGHGQKIVSYLTVNSKKAKHNHHFTQGMSENSSSWSTGWAKDMKGWWTDGWRDPNSALEIQDGADPSEAKVFRSHAPPRCVRESRVCFQTAGLFASRWREPGGHDNQGSAGAEQAQHHERTQEVHRGGPRRGGEDLRSGEELGSAQGCEAQLQ